MRASIVTKLSLYDFFRILGMHPIHAAQINFTPDNRPTKLCDQVMYQYEWQDADRMARESIASAILEAENNIERHIGFHLQPSWEVDEWRPTMDVPLPELVRVDAVDIRGYKQIVKANWGHFISGGIQSKTLIEASSTITYTDPDGDNFDEVATITVTPVASNLDPNEVKLYYPGKGADDSWEIRPVTASIAGVTLTVTFKRVQCVLEELMEAMGPEPVVADDDDNFLETVDVYRVYNDPQTQVSFLWEPTGSCSCGTSGCSSCSYATQAGCLHLRGDPKLSLAAYSPAEWNSDTLEFDAKPYAVTRQPDLVRLYYYSGLRDKNKANPKDMDQYWKGIVAHYAAALLEYPPCNCVEARWEYWREDFAFVSETSNTVRRVTLPVGLSDMDNPFGSRRGQLEAWRRVKQFGLTQIAVS